MPARCRRCGTHAPHQFATDCPVCGTPFYTSNADTIAASAPGWWPFPTGATWTRRTYTRVAAAAFLAGVVLVVVLAAAPGPHDRPPPAEADSTGRVRVGMPVRDLPAALGASAGGGLVRWLAAVPVGPDGGGTVVVTRPDGGRLFIDIEGDCVGALDESPPAAGRPAAAATMDWEYHTGGGHWEYREPADGP